MLLLLLWPTLDPPANALLPLPMGPKQAKLSLYLLTALPCPYGSCQLTATLLLPPDTSCGGGGGSGSAGGVTALPTSDGVLLPKALVAATLNSYLVPGSRFGTCTAEPLYSPRHTSSQLLDMKGRGSAQWQAAAAAAAASGLQRMMML
jgi:hypothetical protein